MRSGARVEGGIHPSTQVEAHETESPRATPRREGAPNNELAIWLRAYPGDGDRGGQGGARVKRRIERAIRIQPCNGHLIAPRRDGGRSINVYLTVPDGNDARCGVDEVGCFEGGVQGT